MSTVQSAPSLVSQDLLNAVNSKKSSSAKEGSVEAEQDKFMKLLVTQLKNQDPMNPLDNAQLTSQFAQLSTVTGVNKLNSTLESLKASYQSSESLQAANMIGHGVLVEDNSIELSGGKAIMGVQLATPADDVKLVVTDKRSGKVVQTIDMGAQGAGTIPVAWDGVPDAGHLGADGKPVTLRDGDYTFKVVAERGGAVLTDAKSLAFDRVASVTNSAKDGVQLNLSNKGAVSMVDIRQIM